jgi:hypothetical protein
MALAWLVVLSIGAVSVGVRLVAVLHRLTKDAR